MKSLKQGFTLIEIVIVISILAILGTIVLQGFTDFQSRQTLGFATKDVRQTLERARSQTIASVNDRQYGVAISGNDIILFSGESYVSGVVENSYTLHPRVYISSIALNNDVDEIVFSRRTGEPSSHGIIEISLVTNPQHRRVITISETGILSSNE